MTRALYDCASVPLTSAGPEVRVVVATHDATSSPPAVGVERDGTVYELFVSTLPAPAFTASDVLDLYLHRGSFETILADEDHEQDADRWYSHTPCGQEFSQILAQWVWNLRLELGQQFAAAELRTTEFAPACEKEAAALEAPEPSEASTPPALPNGRVLLLLMAFPALLSPHNRMERCIALPTTRSIPRNGVSSGMAPCGSCMPHASAIAAPVPCGHSIKRAAPRANRAGWVRYCGHWTLLAQLPRLLRERCLKGSRLLRFSGAIGPAVASGAPGRALIRSQAVRVESSIAPDSTPAPVQSSPPMTRAKRVHWRLSWQERFARNARPADAPGLVVILHGLPATFARAFGFALLATA